MPGDYDIEYASPWAGANVLPVGKPGSQLQKYEEATWPELNRICKHVPEAGIHYQNAVTLGRTKDAGSAVGEWFSELVKEDAWFSKTMPDVSSRFYIISSCGFYSTMLYFSLMNKYSERHRLHRSNRLPFTHISPLFRDSLPRCFSIPYLAFLLFSVSFLSTCKHQRSQILTPPVPCPPKILSPSRLRYWHLLHLSLHKHHYLSPLASRPMSQRGHDHQTQHNHPHL
jgi:hypothetical protein